MSIFREAFPGFFVADLPESLDPVGGLMKARWRYGRKLTGISANGLPMTDGEKSDMDFAGFPWVEFSPNEDLYLVLPLEHLNRVYLKHPTDLVFVASSWKTARPADVAIPLADVWPHDGCPLRLENNEAFRYLALRGKITRASGLMVLAENLTPEDYVALGKRFIPELDTILDVLPDSEMGVRSFRGDPMKIEGFRILEIDAAYTSGFDARRFVVTDPSVAAKRHPFFGRFSEGTTFFSEIYGGNMIPADGLPSYLLGHLAARGEISFYIHPEGAAIEFTPQSVPHFDGCRPVKIGLTDTLTGSDADDLVPFRKVAAKYPNLKKYRFHRLGDEKPMSGFFCFPEDIARANPIDIARTKRLNSLYYWFNPDKHLAFSDQDLAAHHLFKEAIGVDGWSSDEGGNNATERLLYDAAEKFLKNDSRVFRATPVEPSRSIYKKPSLELLAEFPEVHYEFLKGFRELHPHLFSILSLPNTMDILVAGDISS